MTAAIEMEGISRRYIDDGPAALRGVSLTIHAGEFVALRGPSGSGKSSLLNIIGLLDRPTAGSYRLFGNDPRALSTRQLDLARGADIGFVFQSSHMLPDLDVASNVGLSLRCQNMPRSERGEGVGAVLANVGLGGNAQQSARLLSGGERQRAAVARALATEPRLLLADEPTGNLDSDNGRQVIGLLRDAHRRGATVLIVTHDEAVAGAADRVISMRDGRIVNDTGAPDMAETSVGVARVAPGVRRRRASAVDAVDDAVTGLVSRIPRAILLMVAFALGVAGLLGAVGLSTTAAAQIAGRITAASMDQFYVYPADPDSARESRDPRVMAEAVSQLDHVTVVGATVAVADQGSSVSRLLDGGEASVTLRGGTAAYATLAARDLAPAHAAALLDSEEVGPVALVSRDAADELQIPYGPAGPGRGVTIVVNGTTVPVVGVFDASERAPQATTGVIVSLGLVSQIHDAELSLVVITEPGYPAVVADAVPLAIAPGRPATVRAETVADLQGLRVGVSQDLAVMVAVVGAIVLVVAALGAATTLRLSVEARTAEIALRRAVGATRSSIAAIFLLEGLLVGVAGGILGAVLGQLAVIATSAIRSWTPVLPPDAWWQGIVLGAVTGLVSAAHPAWRASRKDPALAIRE